MCVHCSATSGKSLAGMSHWDGSRVTVSSTISPLLLTYWRKDAQHNTVGAKIKNAPGQREQAGRKNHTGQTWAKKKKISSHLKQAGREQTSTGSKVQKTQKCVCANLEGEE